MNRLATELIDECAAVIGALLNETVTPADGAAPQGRQWLVEFAIDGPVVGTGAIAVGHDGAAALARTILGLPADASDNETEDALREVANQTLSALATKHGSGLTLKLGRVICQDSSPAETSAASRTLTMASMDAPIEVAVFSAVTAAAQPVVPPGAAKSFASESEALNDARLDVILDIDLPVVVRFGRTEMPIRMLTKLGPGSVIDLGRSPDDPVDILVSNRVVARGEVVIVGGSYGVRVVDVVSPGERMRTVEA